MSEASRYVDGERFDRDVESHHLIYCDTLPSCVINFLASLCIEIKIACECGFHRLLLAECRDLTECL